MRHLFNVLLHVRVFLHHPEHDPSSYVFHPNAVQLIARFQRNVLQQNSQISAIVLVVKRVVPFGNELFHHVVAKGLGVALLLHLLRPNYVDTRRIAKKLYCATVRVLLSGRAVDDLLQESRSEFVSGDPPSAAHTLIAIRVEDGNSNHFILPGCSTILLSSYIFEMDAWFRDVLSLDSVNAFGIQVNFHVCD